MGLSKWRLGDLIEQVAIFNVNNQYGINDVRGVANTKGMIPTRANMTGRDFSKFYIIRPNDFVFNRRTTRNGERLGMAFNNTNREYLFTNDYVAFCVKENYKNILVPNYLYMFFCRDEFDRYVRINSWGSATEFFNWEDMCNVELELPSIDIQRKYVAIYRSMQANQQAYEDGLDDLKHICDIQIKKLYHTQSLQKLGNFVKQTDYRNGTESELDAKSVRGISIDKKFIETKADLSNVSLKNYKIIYPKEFAYVPVTSRNGEKISLALNDSPKPYLCSSAYLTFAISNKENLLSEYLMLLLSRTDFNQYARFHSWGTARETFDWSEMCDVKIPVPDIKVQRVLADIYTVYQMRKNIGEQLKEKIQSICPILIRGAMLEAQNREG